MSIEQQELPLTRRAKARPYDGLALENLLREREAWVAGIDIRSQFGWSERHLRKVASAASPQIISYPGSSRGYRHIRHCTIEEINHAINALRAQAKEMDKRALGILTAYHRREAGTP